jgi:hypothetical protein
MGIIVFWDAAPCSLVEVYLRFAGVSLLLRHCLPPWEPRISPRQNIISLNLLFLGIIFTICHLLSKWTPYEMRSCNTVRSCTKLCMSIFIAQLKSLSCFKFNILFQKRQQCTKNIWNLNQWKLTVDIICMYLNSRVLLQYRHVKWKRCSAENCKMYAIRCLQSAY